MDVYAVIDELIRQAILNGLITKEDEVYAQNQIMSLLELDEYVESEAGTQKNDIPNLLDELVNYAAEKGIIEDLPDAKEVLSSKIMNVFLPKPSEVNRIFYQKYQISPKEATDYFYQLSRSSNYIQIKRIEKNIKFNVSTAYGDLEITINRSKPEKDPKQIARERELMKDSVRYPKCLLCVENEGYAGRIGYPARSNHRIIRLDLLGETWLLQYSPYAYYQEHCIVISKEHREMKIDRLTFARLLEFVDKFPHYFIGSNADLPIVGGSILSHDHYQGGNHIFPMDQAEDEFTFTLDKFPAVQASTIKWPMSVIRLRSRDKEEMLAAAYDILHKWIHYSDVEVDIVAFTGETRHNTITPIVRKENDQYVMDLILRNNRTSEAHPFGIFHPHADVHHIKRENIGLIEAMGLAILPARLQSELQEVEKYLLDLPNKIEDYHLPWAEELKKQYLSDLSPETVTEIVRNSIGQIFLRMLEDAGVFKRNKIGQVAFRRFLHVL